MANDDKVREMYEKGIKRSLLNEKKQEPGTRIVYGANCVWWETIDKVATLPGGLPCCPHCRSVLFEIGEHEWAANVREQDKKQPGYRDLVMWMRGKCFRTFEQAEAAYKTQKG